MTNLQVVAKEDKIARLRQAEQRAEEIKNLRNQNNSTSEKNGDSDDEPKSRSDELRRQRNMEAQQLIAQRTINARAIFEQNSSAGQTRAAMTHQLRGNNVGAAKRAFEQNQVEQSKSNETAKPE